mgnify:CR=1 FL=1
MAKKILLIDDDPTVVRLLTNRLKVNGYNVVTALTAKKGITKAIEEKPDVIILDILMPKTFGNEIAQQLRKDPHTSKIPVIFLSNVPPQFLSGEETLPGQTQQIVEGTIYLSKLCSTEELLEAIQKALSL